MYRLTKHETMGYCIMEYNYGAMMWQQVTIHNIICT